MPNLILRLSTKLVKAERVLCRLWEATADPTPCFIRPDGISAEEYDRLCHIRFLAEQELETAIWDSAIAKRDRFRSRRGIPRVRDAIKLREQMYKAQTWVETLEGLGPRFYTAAEWHQARAAVWLAEEIYEIAEAKFRDAQRQARADKRAGIVRIWGTRNPNVRPQ
jgi:hypothetical protein